MKYEYKIPDFVEFYKQYSEFVAEEVKQSLVRATEALTMIDKMTELGKGRNLLKNYLSVGIAGSKKIGQYESAFTTARETLKAYDEKAVEILGM